jgi:hypothetical protein
MCRKARQLVLGQLDPLLLAHPLPQRRPVERAAARVQEVAVWRERCVPVDLDGRVVGMLGRGPQQPLRGVFAVGDLTGRRVNCASRGHLRPP